MASRAKEYMIKAKKNNDGDNNQKEGSAMYKALIFSAGIDLMPLLIANETEKEKLLVIHTSVASA